MRTAAWLFGQSGNRRPVQPGAAHGVGVDLVGADLQVGSRRLAVEVQREVVRREDLAERHRRRVLVVGGDVAVVDAEPAQFLADEPAERIVADAGDQRRAVAQAGGGHRDVGRAAAEELAERLDVLESDADLKGVDVDAAAPDGEDVECLVGLVGQDELPNTRHELGWRRGAPVSPQLCSASPLHVKTLS